MGADNLVENNIFQHITAPMMNAGGTGSVFGYNFAVDDYYFVSAWQQSSSYHHAAGNSDHSRPFPAPYHPEHPPKSAATDMQVELVLLPVTTANNNRCAFTSILHFGDRPSTLRLAASTSSHQEPSRRRVPYTRR